MKETLGLVAGILQVVGLIPYIRAILRKKTVPAKASWVIWAILDTLTLAGMYAEGTVNSQILGAVLVVWVVVGLALKYGTPGWTKLDKFCISGAAVGIVLWQAFDNPVLGIMSSLSMTFLGSIPTFASAWKDPSREDKLAWTIIFVSCVCGVAAIPRWTLADAAQPITFLLVVCVMMYLLFVRPHSEAIATKC